MEKNRLKVLVIDNDALLGKVIKHKLGKLNASVTHVTSNDDIIGSYKKLKPDIVIMEPVLGTVSGFDLIQDFPDRKAALIFLTMLNDPSDRKLAVRLGVSYFLNKNEATIDDIIHTVAAVASK